jgi:hypothetical protein
MSHNPHQDPAALKALQDAIYRDEILRARAMTPEQRLDDVFVLSNSAFQRMHEGAMWHLNSDDPAAGWREVRRRLDRLQLVHDRGRFSKESRVADES